LGNDTEQADRRQFMYIPTTRIQPATVLFPYCKADSGIHISSSDAESGVSLPSVLRTHKRLQHFTAKQTQF